ncbi:MAG: RagB/SusD family nutrient uptake outer membrane protein [Prevotella sp.]|nr:RagB/SusD family nutrient uptake outer membrane protein [Prevotella sp.]
MKTKNIAISLLAAAAMLTTSCGDDFLEVTNPNGDFLEDYYKSDEHLQEALIAAYDPIHWPDWGLGQYNALNIDAEIQGDNFWVGGETKNDMANWHKLFNYEGDENNTLSSLWTVDYSGIKRCNDLLRYLGWADESVSESNKKSYEMQARAMRVFYYNMLWHYFGNIPFYLENLNAPYTAPQYKADDVYAELIRELEEVIASNVLPMRWASTEAGRASQAFCYMMYAEMVMYQNDKERYPQALKYMQEIISSSDYALNANYANIWEESGEWTRESIWEINYEDGGNERGWSSPLAIGGTVMPTLISPNNYKGADAWGDGWGFLPVRLEAYNKFEANDLRRDATIWDLRHLTGLPEDQSYHARYQNTFLWLNKYRPRPENNADATFDNNLNYNNNYRYYRYAEALLNAAELLLETGGSASTAADYVNQVRKRAGISTLSSVTKDDIINERDLEFMGEGKRYWDLVRTGKAATVLVPDNYGYRTNKWTENKKYIPIAQGELDSDPALVQNEY